jgi:Concanavalin A-like lectin/glucanases superfamily
MSNKSVHRIVKVGSRRHTLRCVFATLLVFGLLLPWRDQRVRAAQIVLQMDIHQTGSVAGGNLSYYAFAFLNTTNTPVTYDQVYSWNTNYQFFGGVGPGSTTYGLGFGTLADMLNAFTNGPWKLVMNVGDPSEKTYYFSMSAPNFSSNAFPAVHVLSPLNGAVNVTNNPVFTWSGTNNYTEVDVNESGKYQNFNNSATLAPAVTNWNPGQTLNQGLFSFDVTFFNSNAPTALLITMPTNSLGQSPPGWVTTNRLFADDSSQFTVGTVDSSGTSHTLVAHYPWDTTNADGTASGVDSSGNGYDMNFSGSNGSQGGANSITDTAAGPGAIQFHDGDGNSAGFVGWDTTPAGLLTGLSGSFSISCWIKTTQNNFGWDQAPAYYGAGIVAADNNGLANDVIPIALTGNKIGFNTGGDIQDDTVNSATSVNDGNYHHIVVTRNQQTGQKIIYIDGVLDSFSSGTKNLLNDVQKLTIGALADASDPDPNDGDEYNGYDGELDDLQIYSGVLSAGEVANLYANPGSTAANGGGPGGGHKNVAHYAFDDSGNPGHDSSVNGNDMSGPTTWGPEYQSSTDAEAGGGAVQFFGTSALYASGQTLTNVNAALAASFTVSAWVNTTVTNGEDYNNAFFGATIFWAYNDSGNTNDTIPLAITGSKAAFTTRDHLGNFTTLHSISSVNDGNYHLITVTRNQASGEMRMYVDGNFEASDIGTTDPLNGNNYNLTIGGWAYCANGDCTSFYAYNGLLDDVQIYTGVLSDAEVASLYANPGTTVPDVSGGPGGPVVHYDFDEGTVLATDVSGNNNNIINAGGFDGNGPSISTDTAAGSGAVSFDGGSYLTAAPVLLATLASDFTVSLWLKTSQSFGNPGDVAWEGAGVISADSPNFGAKDLIPIALTGGQVAFNVGDGNSDNTLNSSATVNDDNWHHVVVTRSQTTGSRQIYIDGALDSSDVATTLLLNSPVLLTIGAKSDASNPDPSSPDYTGSNGYQGLLDDVQIYDRVLSSDEVAFLYANPGTTLNSVTSTPYPVDVNLQLTIVRSQDPNLGEYFDASVSFNSVNPTPTTTNSVQSPHNYYNSAQYPSGGYGSSQISGSLGEVLNECTNGFWKIYINEGSPTQQVYSFQVSLSGLDTNLLKAVKVFSPTNGSVNVATNPVFYWTGPSNFTTLAVDLLSGPSASLPVAATNWPSAPALSYGTNRFDVDYTSNNFSGVTFTTPLNASSNPVRTWTTTFNLASLSFNNIVVGAPAPLPVLLTNLTRASGNLQFSFKTLAGRPHTVQSRTNLTHGTWINLSNFVGDGSLKQFAFPATNPPVQFFRVLTQ